MDVQISIWLAFAAGFVSFLSACVLPVLPGCVGFVTAVTLDELAGSSAARARRGAVLYAVLFMVGFGLVFLTFGLVPTAVGPPIARSMPWIQRIGGAMLVLYGLHLLGALRFAGRGRNPLTPEAARKARSGGSVAAGVAFGAGWTPCIGPVLGSILLYVTRDPTRVQGGILMLAYAFGLSIPFVVTAVALNWPLAGSRSVANWIAPLRRLAGGVLAALGIAMVTGYFARLTASLAGLGQLINLEF